MLYAHKLQRNGTGNSTGCPLEPLAPYGREKILLISAVFGNLSLQPHIALFLRSAARSGFDFLLVGDDEPKNLPSNVRWLNITWDELWWRVKSRVPHCFKNQTGGGDMNYPERYKVIDLKPLFGVIFMKELYGYHFWGHVDNDIVFGRTRSSINKESMKADVIGIIRGHRFKEGNLAWGPMTLYRNTARATNLFRSGPRLCDMLLDHKHWGFDEWCAFPALPSLPCRLSVCPSSTLPSLVPVSLLFLPLKSEHADACAHNFLQLAPLIGLSC